MNRSLPFSLTPSVTENSDFFIAITNPPARQSDADGFVAAHPDLSALMTAAVAVSDPREVGEPSSNEPRGTQPPEPRTSGPGVGHRG